MPDSPPTQAEALLLHQRLFTTDAVAPSELAEAYWQPLLDRLAQIDPRAPEDLRATAVGDALLALIKRPASYDPARMDLFAYLCMSARGDLLNLRRREARHHARRVGLKTVEDSPDAGKYLGTDDDPSLRLCLAEARDAPPDPAVAAVLATATPQERRVLELMLQGERSTSVFAAALGLADRPTAEQKAAAKRVKERLKLRIKRERRPT